MEGATETAAVTISTILTNVGSVMTSAFSWVGTVASTIAAQPILLFFCVAIPALGIGVGLFKRLLSARG